MTQIDPTQFRNADGSELSDEQIAALTGGAPTPPAAPVVPDPPAGPSLAERELAVAKAGFKIADALVGMFAKAYDGELTSDAITAAAAAIGLTPEGAPAAPPAGDPPAAGNQADARQGLAGSEYVPPPPVVETPYERMHKEVNRVRADGLSEEIQLQVGVQEILQAAIDGDNSVTTAVRHGERRQRWEDLGLVSNTQ